MDKAIFTILFPMAGFIVGAYVALDIIKMLVNVVYAEQGGENE